MVRARYSLRLAVVIASLTAWFVAINHCAFATVLPSAPTVVANDSMPGDCPMHAKEHGAPERQKQNGCGDLPCCNTLQATAVANAKLVASPVWLGLLVTFSIPAIDETCAAEAATSQFSDIGPPGERTFAELVLQRSLLAHAPPVSLS
jgi:hypothetical protein